MARPRNFHAAHEHALKTFQPLVRRDWLGARDDKWRCLESDDGGQRTLLGHRRSRVWALRSSAVFEKQQHVSWPLISGVSASSTSPDLCCQHAGISIEVTSEDIWREKVLELFCLLRLLLLDRDRQSHGRRIAAAVAAAQQSSSPPPTYRSNTGTQIR